jgi:hypothetical protein
MPHERLTSAKRHTGQRVRPTAAFPRSQKSPMSTDTHRQIANDIWSICNLLRGRYKRNE